MRAESVVANKLRICFVGLDNYAFLRPELGITHMGGEAVQQSLLARQFARDGHEVSTIVLDYDQPDGGTIDGINIHRHGHWAIANFVLPPVVQKLLRSTRYDLLVEDINKIPFFTPWYRGRTPLVAIVPTCSAPRSTGRPIR